MFILSGTIILLLIIFWFNGMSMQTKFNKRTFLLFLAIVILFHLMITVTV